MRYAVVLSATLCLAACDKAPVPGNQSSAGNTAAVDPRGQDAAVDSIVQFLISAAATDFDTHRPPDPVRFRDVRLGHLMTDSGERRYLLCGFYLPAQGGGGAEWTPFATIRTDPYEQWLGSQASGYCQGSAITWDSADDLSSLMWSRFASLR
jgi:hypothetical protein